MVYQPPVGARDLFPVDVAQKRWIEDRLQQVFHRWGYQRIITSTLERLDTLMAGGAVEPSTVIQLQDLEGDFLGLRPELTASIARAAVTRMAGVSYPLRLYYNANVFRRSPQSNPSRQQEFYQAGVELLGSNGVAADAEMLFVVSDCLHSLGLQQCHLIVGEAGLTQSLLSPFPNAIRAQVRQAIAKLDRITLETLPIAPELRNHALTLMDLRGQPADVLQRVASLDLTSQQRVVVSNLKALVELLHQGQPHSSNLSIILDLSLIQTFDYYTGIVFEVVEPQGRKVLGQGGRYDRLLELYHPQGDPCPGIGFVFNIEELHQILLSLEQLPLQTPASDWLIVPVTDQAYAAAFTHAQTLRETAGLVRVEVELGDHILPDQVRAYAQHRRISKIVWIQANGEFETEMISWPDS
jgi:ATP phosphoribosyltransferase regulatory subunit